MLNFCLMQMCDAGRGQAAFLVELPRAGVRKRDQEVGAQVYARFRLCSTHAQNVLDRAKDAKAYELPGWLLAHPCGTDYHEEDLTL